MKPKTNTEHVSLYIFIVKSCFYFLFFRCLFICLFVIIIICDGRMRKHIFRIFFSPSFYLLNDRTHTSAALTRTISIIRHLEISNKAQTRWERKKLFKSNNNHLHIVFVRKMLWQLGWTISKMARLFVRLFAVIWDTKRTPFSHSFFS